MRVGYAQTIQEATEKGGFVAAVVIGNYDYFIVNYMLKHFRTRIFC